MRQSYKRNIIGLTFCEKYIENWSWTVSYRSIWYDTVQVQSNTEVYSSFANIYIFPFIKVI